MDSLDVKQIYDECANLLDRYSKESPLPLTIEDAAKFLRYKAWLDYSHIERYESSDYIRITS